MADQASVQASPAGGCESVEPRSDSTTWFYRWFLEHNPLYLISAAAVLVGVFLLSDGLARESGLAAELWLTALGEFYQLLLIGGAALLYRIGQRRPALMLGLLAVVYFGDLAFQNRVAAYLGLLGAAASLCFWLLLAGKLALLAWALRLRLSRIALLLPLLGGAALATLPHLLERRLLQGSTAEAVLVSFVFALFALGCWTERRVSSLDHGLSSWGRTVLRRALRATWLLWGGIVLVHVSLWSHDHGLRPWLVLLAAALLLATRWVIDELRAALLMVGALLLVAVFQPQHCWIVALLASVTSALRSFRRPLRRATVAGTAQAVPHPYRMPSAAPALPLTPQSVALEAPLAAERARWLLGAFCGAYLAIWTAGWQGEGWPQHLLWLDLLATGCLMGLFFGARVRIALLPLLLVHGHRFAQSELLPASSDTLAWGALIVVLGFALLLAGLAINWVGRSRTPPG